MVMLKARGALFAAAMVVVTGTAQPAAAAIMLLTRTATIQAVDGDLYPDLPGTTLTIRIKYDTTKGAFSSSIGDDYSYQRLESDGAASPVLEASYAFGGETFDALEDGSTFSLTQYQYVDGAQQHYLAFKAPGPSRRFELSLFGFGTAGLPLDLTAPFDIETADEGLFAFRHSLGDGAVLSLGETVRGRGRVVVQRLDTPTGAIPEPATWALMIAGFGLAGAALRRRERAAA